MFFDMAKFIRIKFNSAKLVISNKKTNCDYVHDIEGYRERPEQELISIKDCIRFEPISNMLHVMFSERPAATFRGNGFIKRCDCIDEIAQSGYMKIYTVNSFESSNGNMIGITESTHGKKIPFNSHAKLNNVKIGDEYFKGMFTWDLIKRRYKFSNEEKYNEIISAMEKFSGKKAGEVSAIECLELIRNSQHADEASEFFKKQKITPASDYIMTGKCNFESFIHYNACFAAMLVNRYVCSKTSFSGEFLFPVTDSQYEMLCMGKHFATYLDGGVAILETRILDIPEYKLFDYEPIKNLKRICE